MQRDVTHRSCIFERQYGQPAAQQSLAPVKAMWVSAAVSVSAPHATNTAG